MTTAAPPKELRLDLEGMTCASCATRIEKTLNKLEGVEATVNFATEQATVHCDPTVADEALVDAGDRAAGNAVRPREPPRAERAMSGREVLDAARQYTPYRYTHCGGNEMTEITYTVPDMSCGHCKAVVSSELQELSGVSRVEVDLDTKRVVVSGEQLDDSALRAAIAAAGYEAA